MGIQGYPWARRRRPAFARSSGPVLLIVLMCSACSQPASLPEPSDYSQLPPRELLEVFLANEQSLGGVQLSFSGEVTVAAGEIHEFRGAAGYLGCGDFRVKLVGPMGLTLLDYLNRGGQGRLLADKITPEGDGEALNGLMKLMEAFTLALADRCHPADSFEQLDASDGVIDFAARLPGGDQVSWRLERQRAILRQQIITGASLLDMAVDYEDYRLVDTHWFPSSIALKGTEPAVAIEMDISDWRVGVQLPERFFE